MFELDGKCTIGIDLAALSKNPTGLALLKGREAETSLLYTDEEILGKITRSAPLLIAIDAPLSLPKKGEAFRKADREMIKKKRATAYFLQLSPR
jgi:predicted nuclease with RNAse H fold